MQTLNVLWVLYASNENVRSLQDTGILRQSCGAQPVSALTYRSYGKKCGRMHGLPSTPTFILALLVGV